jgi:hypothetical protein
MQNFYQKRRICVLLPLQFQLVIKDYGFGIFVYLCHYYQEVVIEMVYFIGVDYFRKQINSKESDHDKK